MSTLSTKENSAKHNMGSWSVQPMGVKWKQANTREMPGKSALNPVSYACSGLLFAAFVLEAR